MKVGMTEAWQSWHRTLELAEGDKRLKVLRFAAQGMMRFVDLGEVSKQKLVDDLQGLAEIYDLPAKFGADAVQSALAAGVADSADRHEPEPQSAPIADKPSHGGGKRPRRLHHQRASQLPPERLEWIWPGRVAVGKLALFGGPPGLGKSQLTTGMAATVSTGSVWPCGEGRAPVGDVILFSAEDGIGDTIVPRLMAAGADLDRIHVVSAATKPDGTGRKTFSLKTDVDLLEELAAKIGTVRLIVIDPVSAYMGGSDGNGNVETREVLEPLAEMANRLRIAVVAVTHLNKGGGGAQSAVNRFAGSIAFVAAARSAFAILEDPDDDLRRLFLQAKNNLAPQSKGLAFRLQQHIVADDIVASSIVWDGQHVEHHIDDALRSSEGGGANEPATSKGEAIEFLREVLADGPMSALDIEAEAKSACLIGENGSVRHNKPMRSAREALGVVVRRDGFGAGGRWLWSLPASPPTSPLVPSEPIGAPSGDRAPMDKKGTYGANGRVQ